jgi:hypothetical protein
MTRNRLPWQRNTGIWHGVNQSNNGAGKGRRNFNIGFSQAKIARANCSLKSNPQIEFGFLAFSQCHVFTGEKPISQLVPASSRHTLEDALGGHD